MAHLPVELLDTIIGHHRAHRYDLKDYSLVCRAWRFRAQAILFSDVKLEISYPRIRRDNIFASPHLASAIRSITLQNGSLDEIAQLNIPVLQNVTSFTLEHIAIYNSEKEQPARAVFELLRAVCPVATALVLRHAKFRSFRECFDSVFAFAPLDLRLEFMRWPMDQCDIPDYALAAPPLAFRTLGITSTIDDEFYTCLNRRGGIDLTTVERVEYSELESPWSYARRATPVPELIRNCTRLRELHLFFKDKDSSAPDPPQAFLSTIDFAGTTSLRSLTVVVDYRQDLQECFALVVHLFDSLRSFPAPNTLVVNLAVRTMPAYRTPKEEWETFAADWRTCFRGVPLKLKEFSLTMRVKNLYRSLKPITAVNVEMQPYNIVINMEGT